jgi:hypothetical protein
MPVHETTVAVGKCYKTPNNQHRRVIGIAGDQVKYQSWGGNVGYQGEHLFETTVQIGNFSGAVEEEISCPTNLPNLGL